ncbi:aspartyl protease [Winogradskyella eximia]|uniref:Aspartyl protease n=1 Tax=Winogradskyella eximia TaxID=262006 RepID=A0A3D9H1R7_9FLAO|nr:aspartyl protease family protein [Winogradskyella eximia]RED43434.1 aspartyl protease [Winogradskyella eximia]
MNQSINIFIALLISAKLFAADYKPPIIFTKAEIVNASTTRIPFKIVDQLIVVEVELLNIEGNFIIDTGSETLILNSVHFKTTTRFRQENKQASGVHGNIDNVREKLLDKLSIESLNLEQLNADVIDLSHIEKIKKIEVLGIIGYNVLKDFEIFIDMHLNQITLSKTDKNGELLSKKVYAETIHDSINFKLKNHTIVLDALIENHKVKFGLDTGAEYNQLNKKLDSEILDYFYPSKELGLTGASGKKTQVMAGKLYRVKLNDSIYFGPMKTVLTNLKKMNSAFNTNLDGVLGFEFFAQQRTIINYKKQKLYFIKFPIIKP